MDNSILHIDIETYSDVDLKNCGISKYVESPNFEILIIAFCIEFDGVKYATHFVDLKGEDSEQHLNNFITVFNRPGLFKYAHNARFERLCFDAIGIKSHPSDWRCSAIKAATCGLPLGLAVLSEILNLGDKAKDKAGAALIQFFCKPCKPTKANGGITRNLPEHAPDKWKSFIEYCKQDVNAEMAVCDTLSLLPEPEGLWHDYTVDQIINDRGVFIDKTLACNAIELDNIDKDKAKEQLRILTGVINPNSRNQLLDWINYYTGDDFTKFDKAARAEIRDQHKDNSGVTEVIALKEKLGKSSTSKFKKMLDMACSDNRVKGTLQFYGAHTGRWAGRGLQTHNLPRTFLKDLDTQRFMLANVPEYFAEQHEDQASALSSLIRPAIAAPLGSTFYVADYSAIEAVVLAWLVGEQWRLDVFNSHGKIYEASASAMFNIPIDSITKDSEYRSRGKVAELALGYAGGHGAMVAMGAERMGMTEAEINNTIKQWREANPKIKQFWADINNAVKQAIMFSMDIDNAVILCEGKLKVFIRRNEHKVYSDIGKDSPIRTGVLCILLPSGRELRYWNAGIGENKFGTDCMTFTTVTAGKIVSEDTYGGKLTENIVQAIARDLLMFALENAEAQGWQTVMHVHDEIIAEESLKSCRTLAEFCDTMASLPPWAADMPVKAEGYISEYYKKD